jgi:hypothetical protein
MRLFAKAHDDLALAHTRMGVSDGFHNVRINACATRHHKSCMPQLVS